MADENTHENLTLEVRRNDEHGVYEVGYVLDGAFVLLQRQKIAHIEKAVSRYQEEQAQQPAEQPQQPEQNVPPIQTY